jgi:hypothetical protein
MQSCERGRYACVSIDEAAVAQAYNLAQVHIGRWWRLIPYSCHLASLATSAPETRCPRKPGPEAWLLAIQGTLGALDVTWTFSKSCLRMARTSQT